MENYCQSCGMPMGPGISHGTEADGALNEDYCLSCYDGGTFIEELSMEDMIERAVTQYIADNPGISDNMAQEIINDTFPKLKRWQITKDI